MLTAVVVVYNEEDQLDACLSSLAFCDAIVVVLDRCTDNSEAIARRHTSNIKVGAWEGPKGLRRHAGLDEVREGWVLEVDADERVTPALATEVIETIGQASPLAYYIVPVSVRPRGDG